MTTAIQTLPPDLGDLPPGPALVAALAGVDPTRLCHDDALTFLEAQQRQENHQLGVKLAALVEAGRRAPAPPGQSHRLAYPSQGADGEIAALLAWTDRKAARELCFAEWVVTDLPQVHAGLVAGRLDRDRRGCSPITSTTCPHRCRPRSVPRWSARRPGGPPGNWPTGCGA